MVIVGHRGARGEAPENTVDSFSLASSYGTLHFELDIRLSADEKLVCFHDPDLQRTTGAQGPLAARTSTELQALNAGLHFPGWNKVSPVPLLWDVLSACPKAKSWQLEVKKDKQPRLKLLARHLADFIEEFGSSTQLVVTSSHLPFLQLMQKSYPHVALGFIADKPHSRPLTRCHEFRCTHLVSHWKLVTDKLLQAAHRQQMHVSVWTVNDLDLAARLYHLGVDSLITDYPRAFLAHFNSVAAR